MKKYVKLEKTESQIVELKGKTKDDEKQKLKLKEESNF